MGRYEHYKKAKPEPKKVWPKIKKVAIALVIITGLAGFILQFVINLKK